LPAAAEKVRKGMNLRSIFIKDIIVSQIKVIIKTSKTSNTRPKTLSSYLINFKLRILKSKKNRDG
jgi:hypothetical protein